MKLSKLSKARIKRMSSTERKQMVKAAQLLADNEVITHDRYMAMMRVCKSCGGY
jgi:hypothetical protein